jgi:DNA-binding transcriptional LysR family regulator
MDGTPLQDLPIEDLRVFVVAVEEGSLNAAARKLGVPKSTVSRRLARLEERLGTALLHRSARGLAQTDAGRVVFEPARNILDELAALAELARAGMAEPRGRLHVSAPHDLAGMPLWMDFCARHRAVELHVEFSNRYVDVVAEGFDVALRGGRGDDETLIVRRLGSYELRACATPAWAAQHGPFTAETALRELDCVLLAPFRQRPAARRRRAANRHIVGNDLATVVDGVLRGLGVAFLPAHASAKHLRSGRLVSVHPAYDPLAVPLYAAYPNRRYMPAALTAFLQLAGERFGGAEAQTKRRGRRSG